MASSKLMCAEVIFIISVITLGRKDKHISSFMEASQYAPEP